MLLYLGLYIVTLSKKLPPSTILQSTHPRVECWLFIFRPSTKNHDVNNHCPADSGEKFCCRRRSIFFCFYRCSDRHRDLFVSFSLFCTAYSLKSHQSASTRIASLNSSTAAHKTRDKKFTWTTRIESRINQGLTPNFSYLSVVLSSRVHFLVQYSSYSCHTRVTLA